MISQTARVRKIGIISPCSCQQLRSLHEFTVKLQEFLKCQVVPPSLLERIESLSQLAADKSAASDDRVSDEGEGVPSTKVSVKTAILTGLKNPLYVCMITDDCVHRLRAWPKSKNPAMRARLKRVTIQVKVKHMLMPKPSHGSLSFPYVRARLQPCRNTVAQHTGKSGRGVLADCDTD